MNEYILKGKWKQLKGDAQKEWGKLSQHDLDRVEGELTKLEGLIQERYGHTVEESKKQVDAFLARFK